MLKVYIEDFVFGFEFVFGDNVSLFNFFEKLNVVIKIFYGCVECEVSVVINLRKIVNRFLNDLVVKW